MNFKFRCQHCGAESEIVNPLRCVIDCVCGSKQRMLAVPLSDEDGPVILHRTNIPYTSFMGYALSLDRYMGEEKEVYENMGRQENLKWLRETIMRVALDNNNPKIPKRIVVKLAKRLNISDKLAIEYAKDIEKANYFDQDNVNFIVDLDKAITYFRMYAVTEPKRIEPIKQ